MEVKIGVLHTSRELTLDSQMSQDQVEAAVCDAIKDEAPLRLVDTKGTVVVVPRSALAYVEIGATRRGGVGFGAL